MFEFLKKDLTKTFKWTTIVLACLLFFSTCSNCSRKQNVAFTDKAHQEQVETLDATNKQLQDSILVLRGDIIAGDRAIEALRIENEHLREALKQSQEKPVIIYKENQ